MNIKPIERYHSARTVAMEGLELKLNILQYSFSLF